MSERSDISKEGKSLTDTEDAVDDDIAGRFVDALDQEFVPDEIIEEFLLKRSESENLKLSERLPDSTGKTREKIRPTVVIMPPEGVSSSFSSGEIATKPGAVWVNGINHCENDEENIESASEKDSLASDEIEIPAEVLQRFSSRGSFVNNDQRRGSGVSRGSFRVRVINHEESSGSASEEASLNSDDIEIPTEVLQRFSSRGSFTMTDQRRGSGVSRGSFALNERRGSGVSFYDLEDEYLVEAETVVESSDSPIIASAKEVQWWRRNQWFLTSAIVVIAIGITLGIALVTTQKQQQHQDLDTPISATKICRDQTCETFQLIVSHFPEAEELLQNPTPQQNTFDWVTKQASLNPTFYTEKRVLQQYSLGVFFLSTNASSSWHNYPGWMDSSDECEWYGVQCGSKDTILDTTVIGLQLPSNGIHGSIPGDLSILSSSLSSLVLDNNHLSGAIPDEIGHLTLLSTLNLSGNQIKGNIPNSICELANLVVLDLSENSLTSTIPTEIGQISGIQSIQLGNNQLVGSIPSQIGQLAYLQEIDFRENELSYFIPTEVGNLPLLKRLHLQENKLLGTLPSEISSLSELQVLDLSRNYFFDEIPNLLWQVGNLPSLEHLDLSHNLLTGSLADDFGVSWHQLRTLRLGGRNFLKGTIPSVLFSSKLLEELDLSFNYFTGTISDSVSKLRNLKTIDLAHNNLHGGLPEKLYGLQELQSLDLSGNRLEGTLSSSIGDLSNLMSFAISSVSGPIPAELWSLKRLETLSLREASSSGSIPSDIGFLSLLKKIDFHKNLNIIGTLPTELGLLTLLTYLRFSYSSLQGSIPTELGLLSSIEDFDLGSSRLSGTIPSELFNMKSLVKLSTAGNMRIRGTIPTQIGLLTNLEELRMGSSQLEGSIPSEIGNLIKIKKLGFIGNHIQGLLPSEIQHLTNLEMLALTLSEVSGSIPEEVCDIIPRPNIWVECGNVVCSCCGCPQYMPSPFPSLSTAPTQSSYPTHQTKAPSLNPSYLPTLSLKPSRNPSQSPAPSVSPKPTNRNPPSVQNNPATTESCSGFIPLSSYDTLLSFDYRKDRQIIDLPFQFPFFLNSTNEYYSNITVVGSVGKILGGDVKTDFYCSRQIVGAGIMVSDALPLLAADYCGHVYTLYNEEHRSFTVSWEDVALSSRDSHSILADFKLNFQIILYDDGRVEMRWGDGYYPSSYRLLATMVAPCDDFISTISHGPFLYSRGRLQYTEPGVWPNGQCAMFTPNGGDYEVNMRDTK